MAAPTFTLTNHTLLDAADVNTNWNDLTTADADIKVEGSNAMSGVFRADGEQGYADVGSAPSTGVAKTFRGWIFTNNIAYMGTEASDPYKILAYDGSTTELKTAFGSDTYPGGWFNWVIDMDSFTTLTLANVQRWGIECGHASSAKNVVNTWMDVMRYLDGYSMVGGTSGDEVGLSDIATLDKVSAYNVISVSPNASNVYFGTGKIQFGTGATTHYFLMDGDVLTFKDLPIATGLYELIGLGSGTNVVIKNSLIQAAGTTAVTRYVLDMSDTNLDSLSITDTRIVRASTSLFKTGQTVTTNTFDDCLQITHGGATMNACIVKNYEGTAGTAAVLYDVNADPNGEMDGMSFTKGTAATHAIELGTNTPATISLSGHLYSGYNASDEQNDSTIYNNSAKAITINIVGDGNLPSIRNGTSASTSVVLSKNYTLTGIANPSEVTILDRDVTALASTGTATTLAFGDAAATQAYGQEFSGITVKVERIRLRLRKVGSPTDGVYVGLVLDDALSAGYDTISQTLDADDITTSFVEYDFDVQGKYDLTGFGSTFGIQRTGSVDAVNYYEIEYSTTSVITGVRYVNNNGTWTSTTGDLLFSAMEAASDNSLYHVESVTTGTTSYSHGGTSKDIEVLVASINYKQVILVDSISAADKSVPILQIPDLVYSA